MTQQSTPASVTYRLFAQAMAERKQVICSYRGCYREVCPIILGHTDGREMALTFQFAGETSSSLPPEGEWRCLALADVNDAQLRSGPWHSGDSHKQSSSCVEDVDLDVNPASPYKPKRRLKTSLL